jgi:NADH-quinone oxidoreductase subunit N
VIDVSGPETAHILSGVFQLALAEIVLGLVACLFFLGGTYRNERSLWGSAALMALAAAAAVLWLSAERLPTVDDQQEVLGLMNRPPNQLPVLGDPAKAERVMERAEKQLNASLYVRPLLWSRLVILFKVIALVGGAVLVLASWNEVKDETAAEYFACLLIMIAGLMLVPSANDLVTLFLSLELISIPTYIILYTQRHDLAGQEAASKYFLLSIFSSALLLFGFSYLYGMTGTTNIPAIVNGLVQPDEHGLSTMQRQPQHMPALALVALVMVVAGLGFRITAFPFHFYAPDVFQGTTTTTAAILAFVPKVAGFAALMRVLGFVYAAGPNPGLALGWKVPILFITIAALTMVVGNVLALLQDNLRRMLAYSSVAHAGYMLVGLAAAPGLAANPIDRGLEAIVFYVVAYGAMTIGAFAVLAYLQSADRPIETVDDLAGLSQDHPLLALMMALFLFSLIGVPATAGFVGKLLLFLAALAVPGQAALPAEHLRLFPFLAILLAITAAIGAWYYLRIVAAMYLRSPLRPRQTARHWPIAAAIGVCAAITLVLGVYPEPLVKAARMAVGP